MNPTNSLNNLKAGVAQHTASEYPSFLLFLRIAGSDKPRKRAPPWQGRPGQPSPSRPPSYVLTLVGLGPHLPGRGDRPPRISAPCREGTALQPGRSGMVPTVGKRVTIHPYPCTGSQSHATAHTWAHLVETVCGAGPHQGRASWPEQLRAQCGTGAKD